MSTIAPGTSSDLVLTAPEIATLTGGVTQHAAQLRELHAQGFVRARIRRGQIILERAHYEAVCAGRFAIAANEANNDRPRIRKTQHA